MAYLLQGRQVADFRSDTVTRPTPAMRQAMAEAEVGDDVFEDDPTVQRLEARAAQLFGHEAGLFLPTGTMANLVAILGHARPGEEVLLESRAHSYLNEVGGAGRVAGVLTRTLDSARGALDPELVRRSILGGNLHNPRTALLCLENTHNFHGGAVVPLARLQALRAVAREKGVAVHLDGARIWNAVAATGVAAREWGACCDSLSFCLSKGLGAPVGSLLVGGREWIAAARRHRKLLGGGMRQVGVLAAAGLVALEEGPGRLVEDHRRARHLAEGVARIEGAEIDPALVETNILFLRLREAKPEAYPALAEGLAAAGVLAVPLGELGVRFVTHREVDDADVERALEALGRLIPPLRARRTA